MKKMIFILLAFVVIGFGADWSRPIARDSEPGYIYFFGPNFEPSDSTDDWFLYASRDTGKTYNIIKTYDSYLACWDSDISSDASTGVLYYYDGYIEYISFDYGRTFHDTIPLTYFVGGNVAGECYSGLDWSPDYGETIYARTASGIPTDLYATNKCAGYSSGLFYIIVDSPTDDVIFISTDTCNSYSTLRPIIYHDSHIRLGAADREMFVFDYYAIHYSFDGCSTFVDSTVLDHSIVGEFHRFIRGWRSGEIISWQRRTYSDGLYNKIGGWVSIHFSTDCGVTWREIAKHDMLAIEETPNYEEQNELELIQTSSEIISNRNITMYDIMGKNIGSGKRIYTNNIKSGVYLVTDGKNHSKICITK